MRTMICFASHVSKIAPLLKFTQDSTEASHEGKCGIRKATNLQTLLLVCSRRCPGTFWPGGLTSALSMDLSHPWSTPSPRWIQSGVTRLFSYCVTFHFDHSLQQKEEWQQPVHHKVHEEMWRTWTGRAFFIAVFCFYASIYLDVRMFLFV